MASSFNEDDRQPPAYLIERRTEPRHPASGSVRLIVHDGIGATSTVNGDLVDLSSRGCKVRHNFGQLFAGQQVVLFIESEEQKAIAVWTRAYEDYYETGFSFT